MFSSKTKEGGPFCTSIEPNFADFKEDWGEKGLSFLLTLDDSEDYGEKNNLIALISFGCL